jgi:hypothetical protein
MPKALTPAKGGSLKEYYWRFSGSGNIDTIRSTDRGLYILVWSGKTFLRFKTVSIAGVGYR